MSNEGRGGPCPNDTTVEEVWTNQAYTLFVKCILLYADIDERYAKNAYQMFTVWVTILTKKYNRNKTLKNVIK